MGGFLDTPEPCFPLGLVEQGQRQCGFVALQPGEAVPGRVTFQWFQLRPLPGRHQRLRDAHLAFEFYSFRTYSALINPNNDLVRWVLDTMTSSRDHFFFLLDSDERLTAFRTEIDRDFMAGFTANLPRSNAP